MSIVRGPRPDKNFTTLRNQVLLDTRLSFRARGILAAILARPDNWRIDSRQMARESKEGRDAIRKAMLELEACGYLVKVKSMDCLGRWSVDQVVYDTPQATGAGKSGTGEPGTGEPGTTTKTSTKEGDQTTQPRHKKKGEGGRFVPEAPTTPPPGGVDLETGEILSGGYKPCVVCGSTLGNCACFDEEPECGWCGVGNRCVCPEGPAPVRTVR